ncbi:MAG: gamma-glutamyl-gamma-aminobutyrate hydrolase family protein [Prolixibacteraceae bacterium]|nr:gamma-glutamyl-gamma-aminobutyrate hydrolase family protein [Prolixibacteraceae bacterium]
MTSPTIQNIERLNYLINNEILYAGKYEIIGIYFFSEKYDYTQSIRYIRDNHLIKFHMQRITGTLTNENIFGPNNLTNNFDIMFNQSKGLFIWGEETDIQPILYGEKNTGSEVTDPQKNLFELSLVFHLLGNTNNHNFTPFLERNPKYFIIGIDNGMEIMNVATGGSMIQDIPSELYKSESIQETVQINQENLHRNYWQDIFDNSQLMSASFHPIRLEINGFLMKKLKWKRTNVTPPMISSHHQAIKNLEDCWDITARSLDGKVIESIKSRKYPNVFAVQFHPEISELYEENGRKYKFSPRDISASYYERTGKNGRKFLSRFWKMVTKAIIN